LALLLPATLQIPRVARPHICALKVAGEDLLEVLPSIDRVLGQAIEPGPGRVGQVNGEELDNEEVIIHPTCPLCKAVVLHPNTGIGFAVIFDDVIWHLKMFSKAHVVHVTLERLRPWPFRAEAAPFLIIAQAATWVVHVVLEMHPLIPQ
jgi:hypothetical protein